MTSETANVNKPETWGVKMTSKRGLKLVQIKDKCEEDILSGEIETLISKAIIVLLEKEIEKERKSLNS